MYSHLGGDLRLLILNMTIDLGTPTKFVISHSGVQALCILIISTNFSTEISLSHSIMRCGIAE